jgi:hypothetical protein
MEAIGIIITPVICSIWCYPCSDTIFIPNEYGQIMIKIYQWTSHIAEIHQKEGLSDVFSTFSRYTKKSINNIYAALLKPYVYCE